MNNEYKMDKVEIYTIFHDVISSNNDIALLPVDEIKDVLFEVAKNHSEKFYSSKSTDFYCSLVEKYLEDCGYSKINLEYERVIFDAKIIFNDFKKMSSFFCSFNFEDQGKLQIYSPVNSYQLIKDKSDTIQERIDKCVLTLFTEKSEENNQLKKGHCSANDMLDTVKRNVAFNASFIKKIGERLKKINIFRKFAFFWMGNIEWCLGNMELCVGSIADTDRFFHSMNDAYGHMSKTDKNKLESYRMKSEKNKQNAISLAKKLSNELNLIRAKSEETITNENNPCIQEKENIFDTLLDQINFGTEDKIKNIISEHQNNYERFLMVLSTNKSICQSKLNHYTNLRKGLIKNDGSKPQQELQIFLSCQENFQKIIETERELFMEKINGTMLLLKNKESSLNMLEEIYKRNLSDIYNKTKSLEEYLSDLSSPGDQTA